MAKTNKREIYALNVKERQMKELIGLVHEQRQRLIQDIEETGDSHNILKDGISELNGIMTALERAIYFHDKFYEENKTQITQKRKTINQKRASLKKPERRAQNSKNDPQQSPNR
jgi:chromosome segregation ATPase